MDWPDWLADMREQVRAAGLDDAALTGLLPLADVLEKDRTQAEFTLTMQDYLARVVTGARLARGRGMLGRYADLLDRIERAYGVGRHILVAIWGIETGYGAMRGDVGLIAALATLAHDGRRAGFFTGELFAALRMADKARVDPVCLHGSWAGASGHMQFMPSSVLAHGVDFDGDGRIDLWGDDPCDALASAAAFLAGQGWTAGRGSFSEATPGAGFDFATSGKDHLRTIADWQAADLVPDDRECLDPEESASLLLPAGATGPALLWRPNARVLARYNASDSYVVAVAMLAEQLQGLPARDLVWPPEDRALGAGEVQALQRALMAAGHDPGAADGRMGPNTARALKDWQQAAGLVADGHASADMLARLTGLAR
jgi:membrane-bound lytic murein transglycosylase B